MAEDRILKQVAISGFPDSAVTSRWVARKPSNLACSVIRPGGTVS